MRMEKLDEKTRSVYGETYLIFIKSFLDFHREADLEDKV